MLQEIKIENLIYEIRGKQVILDSDLARLYQCKNGTKTINQAIKRHINRFPERFMFQLDNSEFKILQSQIGTANYKTMLATILRTPITEEVSIRIMDAFVAMRHFINENKDIFKRLTTVEYEVIECKDKIYELFDKLEPKKLEKQKIFFNGQIYDSYSLIIELIRKAKERIIIIDNYIDKSILDMLVYKKRKCKCRVNNK